MCRIRCTSRQLTTLVLVERERERERGDNRAKSTSPIERRESQLSEPSEYCRTPTTAKASRAKRYRNDAPMLAHSQNTRVSGMQHPDPDEIDVGTWQSGLTPPCGSGPSRTRTSYWGERARVEKTSRDEALKKAKRKSIERVIWSRVTFHILFRKCENQLSRGRHKSALMSRGSAKVLLACAELLSFSCGLDI